MSDFLSPKKLQFIDMFTAAGGEDPSYPGEARAVWAETGSVCKTSRDGGGVEAEDGGPDAGEGAGTL